MATTTHSKPISNVQLDTIEKLVDIAQHSDIQIDTNKTLMDIAQHVEHINFYINEKDGYCLTPTMMAINAGSITGYYTSDSSLILLESLVISENASIKAKAFYNKNSIELIISNHAVFKEVAGQFDYKKSFLVQSDTIYYCNRLAIKQHTTFKKKGKNIIEKVDASIELERFDNILEELKRLISSSNVIKTDCRD